MITYIFTGIGALFLIAFLLKRDKNGSIVAVALKTLTSLLFITTAIIALMYNISSTDHLNLNNIYHLGLLILGLVFGMVGDILLDFKIYFKTLNMRFLCLNRDHDVLMLTGMTSFGCGHILYITAVALLNPSNAINLVYSALIGLALISLIMLLSIKVLKMNFRNFFVASILYGFLLATFVVFSIFNLCNKFSTGNLLLLIGSIFFIISDLILSTTYFSKKEDYEKKGIMNPESRFMIITNHLTYYIAQFLIAIAIMFL